MPPLLLTDPAVYKESMYHELRIRRRRKRKKKFHQMALETGLVSIRPIKIIVGYCDYEFRDLALSFPSFVFCEYHPPFFNLEWDKKGVGPIDNRPSTN